MGHHPERVSLEGYEITLRGVAGPAVRAEFADLEIEVTSTTTVLRGNINDQAALHGVLQRTQDLGLEVLLVQHPSIED